MTDNVAETIKNLNAATDVEARRWYQEKRKVYFPVILWKMFYQFVQAYVFKGGFRRGYFGFMEALNNSIHQLISFAKYWELNERERGRM